MSRKTKRESTESTGERDTESTEAFDEDESHELGESDGSPLEFNQERPAETADAAETGKPFDSVAAASNVPTSEGAVVRKQQTAGVTDLDLATTATDLPAELSASVPSDTTSAPAAVGVDMRMMSREDKLALLTLRTNLSLPEVSNLSPTDLDFNVRAVLEQDAFAKDQTKRMQAAADQGLGIQDPYGDEKPQHYAVQENKHLIIEGIAVTLRAGQILTERSHNIDALKKSGAKLVKCEAPEPYSPNL